MDSRSQRELNYHYLQCPETAHGEYLQTCLARCGRTIWNGPLGFFWCLERFHQRMLTESPVAFLEVSCTPWCKEQHWQRMERGRDSQVVPGVHERWQRELQVRLAWQQCKAEVPKTDQSPSCVHLTCSFLFFPCQQGECLVLPLHLAWRITQGPPLLLDILL